MFDRNCEPVTICYYLKRCIKLRLSAAEIPCAFTQRARGRHRLPSFAVSPTPRGLPRLRCPAGLEKHPGTCLARRKWPCIFEESSYSTYAKSSVRMIIKICILHVKFVFSPERENNISSNTLSAEAASADFCGNSASQRPHRTRNTSELYIARRKRVFLFQGSALCFRGG